MDDHDKKILADLNAQAEHSIDYLLTKAVGHPATWVIMLGFGLICAFIGGWIMGGFC